jgi:hypothetical protein
MAAKSISSPGHLRWLVWNDSPSGDILAASACVRVYTKAAALAPLATTKRS